MSGRWRKVGGCGSNRWAVAALLAALPIACGGAAERATGQPLADAQGAAAPVGQSAAGNYLAGRVASESRDLRSALGFMRAALERDPDNPELLNNVYLLTVAEGRMDEAADLARRVLALDPQSPIAGHTLALEDIKAGRLDAALTRLGAMPERGLNGLLVPLMKAWSLLGQGKPDAALAALAPLSRAQAFQSLHEIHAAMINDAAGRAAAAEDFYRRTTGDPKAASLRAVELHGNFLERQGRPNDARAVYEAYAKNHPDSLLIEPALERLSRGVVPRPLVHTPAEGIAEGLIGVANALRAQNAVDTALIFGRMALDLRPGLPMAQVIVASVLEAQGRPEEADSLYGTIDPASPFSWMGRMQMADNLADRKRDDEAISLLRAMAAERPERWDPLMAMGDLLRARERFAEAAQAYSDALARLPRIEPQHWGLLYARGIAYERSKQWDKAEADFLKALELQPDQPYVLNYLGYSWVEQGVNIQKAKELIERAVQLRPNDGYIVDSLGWVLYRLGDTENAVVHLERAVELRPEDPTINDHLGDAYWKIGRATEAIYQWKRALTLGPEPEQQREIAAKLEREQGTVASTGSKL